MTSGLSPVPPSPSLHFPTSPGKLTPGCRGNPSPGCASWPGAEGSVWCIEHSQPPGASAASAAPGTASTGPSCGGRGLEGSASTVLLVRGLAGEARPEGAVLGSGAVRAGLGLTCASPVRCAQTCQCQGGWSEGVLAAAHTFSSRLPRGSKLTAPN